MQRTTAKLTLALFGFCLALSQPSTSFAKPPDIQSIPRLQAGLPVGTIAWATPDQLHPTQPQTGKREVLRKTERFKELLKDGGASFSKDLYELSYEKSISPVYIGPTPKTDSRAGHEPVLGYITDRTHGSNAQSEMIRQAYGDLAMSQPLFDKKGRPLNFVLVRVMADRSMLSVEEFNAEMVANRRCYLKKWVRGSSGETLIQPISFESLPERVVDTTDNPFRGLVGELQHEKLLGRSQVEFSQFVYAEALQSHHILDWDEISLSAQPQAYKNAHIKAAAFFTEKSLLGPPGSPAFEEAMRPPQRTCENVF